MKHPNFCQDAPAAQTVGTLSEKSSYKIACNVLWVSKSPEQTHIWMTTDMFLERPWEQNWSRDCFGWELHYLGQKLQEASSMWDVWTDVLQNTCRFLRTMETNTPPKKEPSLAKFGSRKCHVRVYLSATTTLNPENAMGATKNVGQSMLDSQ